MTVKNTNSMATDLEKWYMHYKNQGQITQITIWHHKNRLFWFELKEILLSNDMMQLIIYKKPYVRKIIKIQINQKVFHSHVHWTILYTS